MDLNIGKYRDFKGYKILGWTSDHQVNWYNKLASNVRNGIIVEVGVYGGQTLLGISDTCQKNNTKLYGVDPWELLEFPNGKTWEKPKLEQLRGVLKQVKDNLYKVIEELEYGHIELIQGFSPQEAAHFEDKSVDLLFIDGSHCYESVTKDLTGWLPKMKEGGKICGDDFVWSEVARAVKDFAQKNGFKVRSGGSIGADERCWELVKK